MVRILLIVGPGARRLCPGSTSEFAFRISRSEASID